MKNYRSSHNKKLSLSKIKVSKLNNSNKIIGGLGTVSTGPCGSFGVLCIQKIDMR